MERISLSGGRKPERKGERSPPHNLNGDITGRKGEKTLLNCIFTKVHATLKTRAGHAALSFEKKGNKYGSF